MHKSAIKTKLINKSIAVKIMKTLNFPAESGSKIKNCFFIFEYIFTQKIDLQKIYRRVLRVIPLVKKLFLIHFFHFYSCLSRPRWCRKKRKGVPFTFL
jgi:hypothetical protein